jgi:hypothetical protein
MSLDSAKVHVAVTGAVSYAPLAAASPTDATTPLPAAYRDVGYISEDGVTEGRDRSTTNIIAWQNADVVRAVVTEAMITVQFTMIETNPNSVELSYGSAVDPSDGSVAIIPARTGGRRKFVIDYIDGSRFVRLFIAQGEVMEVGETTLASGDVVGYDVTITGYPDLALGMSAKKWFSDLKVGAFGAVEIGASTEDTGLEPVEDDELVAP